MDIKLYHDFAVKTVKKAGQILLDYYQTNIQINYKGGDKRNLVTEVDTLAEKFIVDAIKKKFPTHCFLAEEGGDCGIKPSDFRWIIDPIDGTTNYAHGYNFYAVSVALKYKNEILVGVTYAPMLKELFHAGKGLGAWLNKKRLHVSKTLKVETSLLATGFNASEKGRNIPLFTYILPKSQGIRRAGSAALDISYAAAGRLDGYWEMAIYPWDIAAGIILVQEAGGTVTDIEGKTPNLETFEAITILATNGNIHQEMLQNIEIGKKCSS
jgi:myo-inositol-1(or 4)-monophosphatase